MSTAELAYELPGEGRVVFTSRAEGNLSSVGGAEAELGAERREALRARLGVRALARGYQVHGTIVRRVHALAQAAVEGDHADGQATALWDLGAMVLVADCMPVAVGGAGGVAMLHAGWRGLAGGVLEEGVEALGELGAHPPLVAVIGPCAGPCCYEVGEEVHAVLGEEHRRGRNADLPAVAQARLYAAGVSDVRVDGACTICDERFFSHRREGDTAGRQAGVSWLS